VTGVPASTSNSKLDSGTDIPALHHHPFVVVGEQHNVVVPSVLLVAIPASSSPRTTTIDSIRIRAGIFELDSKWL
jgi:hypothetical protein